MPSPTPAEKDKKESKETSKPSDLKKGNADVRKMKAITEVSKLLIEKYQSGENLDFKVVMSTSNFHPYPL
jgi:hypothetical protein